MIQLYKYQQEYFEYIVTRNKHNWIYAWDVGTGKTIIALKHYEHFYKDSQVLIVAPKSKLVEGGWDRTIKDVVPTMKYETCSYSMLHKRYKQYNDYFVIFDEIHNLKNSTSLRGKAGYELTKIARGFIGLSATPMGNGWIDSINYFKMFGLTKNKTQFLRQNAITDTTHGYMEITGWKNETKLKNMWMSISKELRRNETIDLPSLIFKDIHFRASNIYKVIKKDRIYDDILYDNQMKLRHGLRLYANLKDKIEYIKDFIESTNDNIIIFYNYDKELELLKSSINKKIYVINGANKDIPKKEDWKNITNSVIICNFGSGAEAIELTFANIIIYFSPTESYIQWEQSIGRAYRIGQKKKVIAYKLITDKTIEEDIYKSLDIKQDFNFKIWSDTHCS